MSFPWRAVVKAVGSGATTMFIPQLAPLIIPAMNAALQEHDEGDLERWMSQVDDLAKNGRIETNKGRALLMKGVIRYDLYKKRNEIPAKEEVNWLLETLVMTYYGVESVSDLEG